MPQEDLNSELRGPKDRHFSTGDVEIAQVSKSKLRLVGPLHNTCGVMCVQVVSSIARHLPLILSQDMSLLKSDQDLPKHRPSVMSRVGRERGLRVGIGNPDPAES